MRSPETWCDAIVKDVEELETGASAQLQGLLRSLGTSVRADPNAIEWRSLINAIAGLIARVSVGRHTLAYRRLARFVAENGDLLDPSPSLKQDEQRSRNPEPNKQNRPEVSPVKHSSTDVTRRGAIEQLLVLPALAGALAVGGTGVARADSRTDLKYQSTPKGGQKCSDGVLFVPGKTAKDNGTCKIITGAISPNGWCTAFAKRST